MELFCQMAREVPSLPMVARDRHPSSGVWLTITPHSPLFLVSVVSKGLSSAVSFPPAEAAVEDEKKKSQTHNLAEYELPRPFGGASQWQHHDRR